MAKQAETEYSKARKEMDQQQHKIDKATDEIQNEVKVQQNLKKEKTVIEQEIHALAKEADELENVLNGYKENVRLAKEGIITVDFFKMSKFYPTFLYLHTIIVCLQFQCFSS